MKNNNSGLRGFIILVIFALSIFSLKPSFDVHSLSGKVKDEFIKTNPKIAAKAVNFGLDLAGGTNIVVEIDKSKLTEDDAADALERSLEIIRNRVDQFGLSEPQISPSGDNRIVADLAGVDAEQARELIGQTAMLEFKLVVEPEQFTTVLNAIDQNLTRRASGLKDKDTAALADTSAQNVDSTITTAQSDTNEVATDADLDLLMGGTANKDTVVKTDISSSAGEEVASLGSLEEFKTRPFSSMLTRFGNDIAIREADIPAIKNVLETPAIQALIPRNMIFVWGRGFEKLENGDKVKKLWALKRIAEMDGRDIADADPLRLSEGLTTGQLAVNLKFKGMGPKMFAAVTGRNVGRQLAIVLDNQVISAPVIRDKIANGNAQITGLDDMNEAKQLAVVLRAGALPAPMKIIELRSVGATLGEDNIVSGIYSVILGLALVVVFMVMFYYGAGAIAILALVFNLLIMGAVMSMFNATLTLPGIAGIILTIGMAVDSNVIIFERIREELVAGKTARTAVTAGYEKAFSTIFDANITTFLTAFILYKIGSGPIRGFGLVLMIGIVASMFTALTFTRYIFDKKLKNSDSHKMSIGKGIDYINNAAFPIIANVKPFIMVSVLVVIASLVLLGTKGLTYGIDFTGGHVITLEFKGKAPETSELRSELEKSNIADPVIQPLAGGDGQRFLIRLQSGENETPVAELITNALGSKYQMDVVNEEIVGPSIGSELRKDALWAVFWSMLLIVLYIWVRFGKHGLGFGLGAVVALIHDVTITLGLAVIFELSVDATIIAAILTVVGYSLNDTIVIFDRIRENSVLLGKDTFESRANTSINQSLSRTLVTSLTTLFVVIVMAVMGGSSIQGFAIALTIGVVVGTYSSIFIASPFVVWWSQRYAVRR
jgi:SecD/SecF fusion protein